EPASPSNGGGDLLKTLANALMNRQQALNDYSAEGEINKFGLLI
ncbi:10125_t:CDS:2, partial [Diversispora eburnea]